MQPSTIFLSTIVVLLLIIQNISARKGLTDEQKEAIKNLKDDDTLTKEEIQAKIKTFIQSLPRDKQASAKKESEKIAPRGQKNGKNGMRKGKNVLTEDQKQAIKSIKKDSTLTMEQKKAKIKEVFKNLPAENQASAVEESEVVNK